MIPSVPEIRRLIARITLPAIRDIAAAMDWSHWRRTHQANAADAHYRMRSKMQL